MAKLLDYYPVEYKHLKDTSIIIESSDEYVLVDSEKFLELNQIFVTKWVLKRDESLPTAECIAIHNGSEYEKMIEYFDKMNHSNINVRKHSRYIFSKALETVVEDGRIYIGDMLKRDYPLIPKWRLFEAAQEDEYSVYYLVPMTD